MYSHLFDTKKKLVSIEIYKLSEIHFTTSNFHELQNIIRA